MGHILISLVLFYFLKISLKDSLPKYSRNIVHARNSLIDKKLAKPKYSILRLLRYHTYHTSSYPYRYA